MSVAIYVTPPNNEEGVALVPNITAIFPFCAEEGTLNKTNCFLIQKKADQLSNSTDIVDIKIEIQRITLHDETLYTLKNYGDTGPTKHLYRSKIIITPIVPLTPHAQYSVILSKDISTITVFDIKPVAGNTGLVSPVGVGPYLGNLPDMYTVTILTSGDENSAGYKAVRMSDGKSFLNLKAKKRFVEINDGILIKFPAGNYVAGDKFEIRVMPRDAINEIYSWNFTTGDSSFIEPTDSKSETIIKLPTNQPPPISIAGNFALIKSNPYDGESMFEPGSKGYVDFGNLRITAKKRTSSVNGKLVKMYIGDESVYDTPSGLLITFPEFSLKSKIVTMINDADVPFTAELMGDDEPASENLAGKAIAMGQDGGTVVLKFSKPINPSSVNIEKIKINGDSLSSNDFGKMEYEYEVVGKELIIRFL